MKHLWRAGLAALGFGLILALTAPEAPAQDLSGLARIEPAMVSLEDSARGRVTLALGLSQPVPFRLFTLDAPRRLVIDFSEVDWQAMPEAALFNRSTSVPSLRTGQFRPGWSRMVLDLARPLAVEVASLQTDPDGGPARMTVTLATTTPEAFAAQAGAPKAATFGTRTTARNTPKLRQTGNGPITVVLDPGHGGIDPGAENGAVTEADVILTFARELKEVLLRSGQFRVVMTREEDVFVPLETRVTIARESGADVFLSLHADAIAEGRAEGATVYTLSDRASDAASQKLAERHDRADLLAGIDLSEQDDVVAGVLMGMARVETAPRSDRLAGLLVTHLTSTVGMHKRPRLEAGFSVLKAPDIPSVLLEVGFLSSAKDLARLQDPAWRSTAAGAIRDALIDWTAEDAAEARLLRQ
ncbi:N-acetylmuramoyl-L-alanine amidase AmiC precursor [Aquimixticola soesokkakensis]|uniref:N-acetylmuramoyl-L-alanine amidase n=1 Tax=Aquimixticola soesokkakensis TaxID=1519096 RepID=A0A1Y5SN57_9RHOB|nr:N-acetylmuramoyl-L-alanine amidase [Aquimixticola soesokkakensis]SLN44534.1 N-acetylmuramoyl-L-alanine amidase AmiC precursor [Aquimixticola soesokkakensis]